MMKGVVRYSSSITITAENRAELKRTSLSLRYLEIMIWTNRWLCTLPQSWIVSVTW